MKRIMVLTAIWGILSCSSVMAQAKQGREMCETMSMLVSHCYTSEMSPAALLRLGEQKGVDTKTLDFMVDMCKVVSEGKRLGVPMRKMQNIAFDACFNVFVRESF